MKIIITQFNRSWRHCRPLCACIQLLFISEGWMDCFHQKTYRQEYIADDFNANTIAVIGSRRVCGDPVMKRSPILSSLKRLDVK